MNVPFFSLKMPGVILHVLISSKKEENVESQNLVTKSVQKWNCFRKVVCNVIKTLPEV